MFSHCKARCAFPSLHLLTLTGFALALCGCTTARAAVTVRLDPAVKHQTIRGWSCNPWYKGIAPRLRDQVVDAAVNELGLTRVRWQAPQGSRAGEKSWELLNDDGDPDTVNRKGFGTDEADRQIETWVVPFKQRVEANGDPFELWFSPSFFDGGSTGSVPAWILQSPGEYAEYVSAYLTHLKQKYGVEATHYVICNEAGNNNAFQPPVVIEMTKTLAPRLKALGLATRGQFSDGVNADVTWRYIQAAQNDAEFWNCIDVLSYHWYGSNNQLAVAKIGDFGRRNGLDTGQTEFMGLTLNHLYDDLTIGGVSYWCIYGLGGPGGGNQNFGFSLANTAFTRGSQFWNFRQVMHYVRPGAVRVEASSDDAGVRPLAFVRNGKSTVVLLNNTPPQQARTVTVSTLPAGRYGVCRSVGGRVYEELGVKDVDAQGTLTVDLPANAAVTLYPHPGGNLPPVATGWQCRPEYLTQPASTVTLSASAQDPELDPLAYAWSVTGQPQGANAVLATPNAATTTATGLTADGQYVFGVWISDGHATVKREVLLNVYAGNQPPVPNDVHNRLPVMVTLPQTSTELRGGGWDLEGDPITLHWRVVSQPAGAAAVLETPNQGKCKLSGLTVPGDYVFELDVSDPTHTVPARHTVTVYPENHAPVIEAATATPDTLAPSANATVMLSAQTSDPDGDVISHWWRVKAAPAGASPVFSKQGGAKTSVTGLSLAGRYLFSLTAVDRTKFVTREVVVSVGAPGAGAASGAGPVAAPAPANGTGAAPVLEGLMDPPDPTPGSETPRARGAGVGTVVQKGPNWIEIRSASGKVARYIPKWIGGGPAQGGGPERRIVQALSQLRAGDRVRVQWLVNDHIRIEEIAPAP